MAEMITVSALNRYVRSLLEGDENLADIAIKGEISNFNRHFKTGHCYFTLKDASASVKAVLFKSDADGLSFRPENGMSVVARCRVSLFERDGAYQLYVDALFQEGAGLAQLAFEQLKARLDKEGLFAVEHKIPIPSFPRAVGLVTSKTGAALQDILQVAQRRCPSAELLLAPVRVQGMEAAAEIASAIKLLDESGLVDTIIVARGGGSAEDLAVFNDEEIARTVYDARTPVVSAIGHEIDFTILDLVADLRAPTPSAAAELALPDLNEYIRRINLLFKNIQSNMQRRLELCYNKVMYSQKHHALQRVVQFPEINARRLRSLAAAIAGRQRVRLMYEKNRFEKAAALAAGLNPYAALARGYAIPVMDKTPLKNVKDAKVGAKLTLKMHDGTIQTVIESVAHKAEVI